MSFQLPPCLLVIGHLHVPPFLTNHRLVAFILTLVHRIAHCVNIIPVLGSFVVFLQISSTSFHMPVASSCWNFFAQSPLTSPSSSCRIDCASFTAPCVLQYCLCRLSSDKLQTSQDLSCLKPSLVSFQHIAICIHTFRCSDTIKYQSIRNGRTKANLHLSSVSNLVWFQDMSPFVAAALPPSNTPLHNSHHH